MSGERSPEWLDQIGNPDGFDPPWPPEHGVYFERSFACPCREEWIDVHDANCNDKCPSCNLEIEPRKAKELDALTGSYLPEARESA